MKKQIRKIAVIANYRPARTYLKSWEKEFSKNHMHVTFFSHSRLKNDAYEEKQILSSSKAKKRFFQFSILWPIEFLRFVCKHKREYSLKRVFKLWLKYAPLIKYKPDIVLISQAQLFPSIDRIKLTSKKIISFRGSDILIRPLYDTGWKKCLEEQLFQQADCMQYVCNHIHRKGLELGSDPNTSIVLYPGIDIKFFDPNKFSPKNRPAKEITLTTTASLNWVKGHVFALQAVKMIKDSGCNIRYNIIGGGDLYSQLICWIKLLEIEENVHMPGNYVTPEKVYDYLIETDIYVHPSISEAIPLAIMEAMAMQLPVVATRVGCVNELVLDGKTGFLVPRGNPDALAAKVITLVEDKALRQEYGKAARQRVKAHFSLKREVREWRQLFSEIC